MRSREDVRFVLSNYRMRLKPEGLLVRRQTEAVYAIPHQAISTLLRG